jgi:hypothetical protein
MLKHRRNLLMINAHILSVEVGQKCFKVVLEMAVRAFHWDGLLKVEVLVSVCYSVSVHFPPSLRYINNWVVNFQTYKHFNLLQIAIHVHLCSELADTLWRILLFPIRWLSVLLSFWFSFVHISMYSTNVVWNSFYYLTNEREHSGQRVSKSRWNSINCCLKLLLSSSNFLLHLSTFLM